jgi:hypothetical protein
MSDGVFVMSEQPRRVFWRANRHEPTKVIIHADYEGEDPARQHLRFDELSCYAASHFSVIKVEARWSLHNLQATSRLPLLASLPETQRVLVLMGLGNLEVPWGIACGGAAADLLNDKPSALTGLLAASCDSTGDSAAISHHQHVEPKRRDPTRRGNTPERTSSARPGSASYLNFPEFTWPKNPPTPHSFHRYQTGRDWHTGSF